MGYLVSIIGNSGVGKTTMAAHLAEQTGFFAAKEELDQRPFQDAFAQNLTRYALANQIDFLLYRAEQERQIRSKQGIGIQDGGLDLDFHLFTRLFHRLGYLSKDEFEICGRLHRLLRSSLQGPDLFVHLDAPLEVVSGRYEARQRSKEIARRQDIEELQGILEDWLVKIDPSRILTITAVDDLYTLSGGVAQVAQSIKDLSHGWRQ